MKTLKELIGDDEQSFRQEIRSKIILMLLPLVAMIVNLEYAYSERTSFLQMIKDETSFTCKSKNSESFNISIDKSDGWILKDNYFIKGNDKIYIDRCKKTEQTNRKDEL